MVKSPDHQVWPKPSIWQGTAKGGKRQGRQKKRWEKNIKEWTGKELFKSPGGSKEQRKMEETGCEVFWGALTSLVVKG